MASSARIDELRKKFDENPRRYFAPLANEYRKAGDLEQAIFICQEYLPQQPGHMSGHIVYGQALFEQGRFEEARQVFETALSLDPENLIALRHLGDIARRLGDSRAARTWYQRVLEADPRNEEIAQIMMSLLSTPAIQQQPAVPPPPTPSIPARAIDSSRPTDPAGVHPEDAIFTVEKSTDRSDLTVGPELSALPERQAPPPTPAQSWAQASRIPDEELLDLNDFSVGGVMLSDLGTSPSIDEPIDETTSEAPPSESTFSDEPFTESPAFVVDSQPSFVAGAPFSKPSASEDAITEEIEALEPDATSDTSEEAFEADPFAMTAAPDGPAEELGTDINLGLPDDGTAPTFADPRDESLLGLETFEPGIFTAASEEPATGLDFESFFSKAESDQAASSLPPLEPAAEEPTETFALADNTPVFESGLMTPTAASETHSAPPPDPTIFVEAETPIAGLHSQLEGTPELEHTWDDAPPAEPDSAPAEAWTEPTVAEAAGAESLAEALETPRPEAFVTETMAELYLQQGHLEPALEIYQQLVEQRPDDEQLRDRLRVIEDGIRGQPPEFDTPLPDEVVSAAEQQPTVAHKGPTIREFLAGLVTGPWASAAPQAPPVDYVDDLPLESEVAFETADVAPTFAVNSRPSMGDADAPRRSSEMPPQARGTPSSSETVSGSIDALFSGADASTHDASAASTLAQAFSPEAPESAPLHGMPAHAASSELSLDHVFKTGQAPRQGTESEGFSFDQFFSDEMVDSAGKPGTDTPAASSQGGDDIAQFNNWLNGLKKS